MALRAASMAATASCFAFSMAALTSLRAASNAALMPALIELKNDVAFDESQPKKPPLDSCSPFRFSLSAFCSASARAVSASLLPSSMAVEASFSPFTRWTSTSSSPSAVTSSACA